MFKPFEIYCKKKFEARNESIDESRLSEARADWNALSIKKQTKFIRKAEAAYDASEDNHKEPFYSYLTKKELDLLMKVYGLPEKPPQNSRLYYIGKKKDQHVNETPSKIQEVANNASEQWKILPHEEKEKINEEFHQLQENYNDKFFEFARNLPEQRVVDYKYYSSTFKKSDLNEPESNENSSESKTKKKSRENPYKIFIPLEVYIEKHRENTDVQSLEERFKHRSAYHVLPDKKKLKYIKKAEKRYDSYDFDAISKKPLFTSFLSKYEVQLLFDSYGMPDVVPSNLSAYFMKKLFKSGLKDMREVFKKFRKLNAKEKSELVSEHARALKEYVVELRKFVQALPPNRLDDYKGLKVANNAKAKSVEDAGPSNKKLKLN